MEIWVRSQDKEELVKVDTLKMFYLTNQGYGIFTNSHVSPNDRMNLGYYSTKEKALKVLDEIEKHIAQCELNKLIALKPNEISLISPSIISKELIKVFTFQMPEDKEV